VEAVAAAAAPAKENKENRIASAAPKREPLEKITKAS
jgi:hypothetical protein